MQAAVPVGVGAMAAVMGLDAAAVTALCADAAGGEVLAPANLNGAGQVVVAGHAAAVDRLVAPRRRAAGRASSALDVSAPFHCALMAPAADGRGALPGRRRAARPARPGRDQRRGPAGARARRRRGAARVGR